LPSTITLAPYPFKAATERVAAFLRIRAYVLPRSEQVGRRAVFFYRIQLRPCDPEFLEQFRFRHRILILPARTVMNRMPKPIAITTSRAICLEVAGEATLGSCKADITGVRRLGDWFGLTLGFR
jgi:hypothetical protein